MTVRGKGGGMRLARTPDMINVGNLVRDTEDNMDIAECFSSRRASNCPMLPECALPSVLVDARKSFLATLDYYLGRTSWGAATRLVAPLHPAHGTFSAAKPRRKRRG